MHQTSNVETTWKMENKLNKSEILFQETINKASLVINTKTKAK